eukprot:8819669-Pyramimonas_sp.AAC.1
MSEDVVTHCFLRAAAQTNGLRLGRQAVPEKVSASKASRSIDPRDRAEPSGAFHFSFLVLDKLPRARVSRNHTV